MPSDPCLATQPLLVTQSRKKPPVLVTQPRPLLFLLRTIPTTSFKSPSNALPQDGHPLPYFPFPVLPELLPVCLSSYNRHTKPSILSSLRNTPPHGDGHIHPHPMPQIMESRFSWPFLCSSVNFKYLCFRERTI